MPVYYYIQNGIGVEEARSLNTGQTNWKPKDYIKSFADSGNENYIRLMELINKYKHFKIQEIYAISRNIVMNTGYQADVLKNGKYILDEKTFNEVSKRLDILEECYDSLAKIIGSRRTAVTALAWCLSVEGVDVKRLIKVVNTKYPLIRPVVSSGLFLQDISEIYNKGCKKRIYFEVEYKETMKGANKNDKR